MTISTVFQLLTALAAGIVGAYVIYALAASSLPCLPGFYRRNAEASPFADIPYRADRAQGPDRIALLETPAEGLGFRLSLFENVQSTLEVVCHTIHGGVTTSAFFGGILQAANRGVSVRILLDGKASSIRPSVLQMMRALAAHPNIECRRYNPLHVLKPWKWHFLMHDKYILADGRYLLLGGRNIGDKFFAPEGYRGKLSNDRDAFVACMEASVPLESAVRQACEYFQTMWTARETAPLRPAPAGARRSADALSALCREADAFAERYPAYFQCGFGEYLSRARSTRKITLLYNPPDARRKTPWIWHQLHRLALEAETSVVLQSPYITANHSILAGLRRVAERVSLSILTNSAASTPNYPAYSNYYARRRRFMETGARIYEYQNAHSIHGKAMVVDKRLGILGSFNLDDRSMFLDTEVMLVVDSEAFAEGLTEGIRAYQAQSLCVAGERERTLPQRVVKTLPPPYKIPLLRLVSVFSLALRSFI